MINEKISKNVIGAIVATGIMSFCGVVIETAMNITFPTLMSEFNIDTATVQWMTTIYLLIVAIIVPLSAIFKKSFKTKNLFLAANLLFLLGVALDWLAPTFTLLLLGRIIQGVGTGIALPLMFNIILEQVPRSKIGMMMGVGTLITAVAPAVGPTFGGIVVTNLGWRYIFVFLLPILVISLIIGLLTIEQKSEVKRTKLDILSFLFIVMMFAGFIIGFSSMGTEAVVSMSVLGAFIIGILGTVGLFVRSSKLEHPIIHLEVLKNTIFSGHVVAFFLLQLVSLGLSFILPNYIQLVGGNTATVAGLVVLPGAVLGAIFAPFGGRILDSFGPRKPILIGACCTVASLILLSVFSLNMSNLLIGGLYLLFMAGIGLGFGNIMTSGLSNLEPQQRTDGNAILTTLQQFAGATGTAIVSTIIAKSQVNTSVALSDSTATGSQHAFIFLLVLGIIEFVLLARVVKKNK
ncbi:MAG: DHA2 family efflux MFS transporter permease subunit [Enterococcus sp.]